VLPDTGLAHEHPALVRAAYGSVFRVLGFLPFVSSARVSGSAMATLLCEDPVPARSGVYLDHRLNEVSPSARATDVSYQEAVLRDSRSLLAAL